MKSKVIPKELKELDNLEGSPLVLLRQVLDTFGVPYITPEPEKEDRVVRQIAGITLHPFLEPNSVVLVQEKQGWTFITAIEQLTKVNCLSFRTQLNLGDQHITHSDLVTHPGTMEDTRAGRILLAARGKDLRLLLETKPGDQVGQCTTEVILPNILPLDYPYPDNQTLEIVLRYKGDSPFTMELTGKIYIWKY